ncbi:MAG: septal ring lytic transglycosylase RlpA family protein [Alphaproteobacteria bacterium]|nr:septal ring lytic transglycosylase RlpA family protein [Alphaproteobacteria bacterium]
MPDLSQLRFVVICRALVLSTAAIAATFSFAQPGIAKRPNAVHCHKGICYRVKSLAETRALIGKTLRLKASHYGHCKRDRFNPCGLTSSGERFRAHAADNAASPDLPDGTVVLLYYPQSGGAAVVRINNAGPYWADRRLDVSKATAVALGFARKGVAQLEVRVLRAPHDDESRYRRHRRYKRVPGYIGTYSSLDRAHQAIIEVASFRRAGLGGLKASSNMTRLAQETVPLSSPSVDIEILAFARSDPARPSTMAKPVLLDKPALEGLSSFPATKSDAPGPVTFQEARARDVLHHQSSQARVAALAVRHFAPQAPPQSRVLSALPVRQRMSSQKPNEVLASKPVETLMASIRGSDLNTAWPNAPIKIAKRPKHMIVAWSYEETLIGRLDLLATNARLLARRNATTDPTKLNSRQLHQQALTKHAAAIIGERLDGFANAVFSALEFAGRKARASVRKRNSRTANVLPVHPGRLANARHNTFRR